jgi:hypothetical protein
MLAQLFLRLAALQTLNPRRITALTRDCSTAEQLVAIIDRHLGSMDAINLAAAIVQLSRLRCTHPEAYAACLQRYLPLVPDDTPRHVANVLYALCKAPTAIRQQHQAVLQQQLLPAFMSKLQDAAPQNISNVLYGMAFSGQPLQQQQMQQLVTAFIGILHQAKPQEVSNTLWAVATMGQQVPARQLQQLLDALVDMRQQAKPQAVSNTLWAVATMGQQVPAVQLQQLLDAVVDMRQQANAQNLSNTLWAVATMGQQVPAVQLQQLLDAVVDMRQQANAQNLSNTLWAVATMGQQVPAEQVQQLLGALVDVRHKTKPQDVSNTLWAVATMGQQLPAAQLQQLLGALRKQLQRAMPQHIANTLWACAKQQYLPQQLLTAPGVVEPLRAGSAQNLANAAWACGQLGHGDGLLVAALLAEVQQRLASGAVHDSNKFTSQGLCNLCWAAAVLDLQQQASQLQQLAHACSSIWSSTATENHQQLWQVHTWLLDFQLAGGQGLQGSLTEQQLQQCRAAWEQQMQDTARQRVTDFQRSVFAAMSQLPIIWQQQPQMEQLSFGRDGVIADGTLLVDIAGRTAAGVLVAVEADGPWHFRQPDGGLMGPTQYRNRALAVRGYRVVSVPWFEWSKLQGKEQQQQYLLRLFSAAGVV